MLAASLSLVGVSEAAPPPADGTYRSADALLERARDHLARNRFAEALPLLEEAYAKNPNSYNIVGNLGIVEHELGRWAAAATHLSEARRRFPKDGPPRHREAIDKRLADASERAGRLTVALRPEEGCVSVEGGLRACGGGQVTLFVTAGPVIFSVEAPGRVTQRRKVEVEAGRETALSVVLPSAPKPAPSPTSTTSSSDEVLPTWPSYVIVGVGGATVVGGVVMFMVGDAAARGADDELGALRDDTGQPAPCETPSSAAVSSRCDVIARDLRVHDQVYHQATGVVLGGVGIMALGGVLFGLSIADDDAGDTAITVAPTISLRVTGLQIHGHF